MSAIGRIGGVGRLGLVAAAVRQLFDPGSLFATGAQGVWYDPSDFSTLFQDVAGTTPVTAVEQPVGLMLDKSKGLVLGPELYSGGDITGLPIGGATFNNYPLGITALAGKTYRFSINVSGYAGTGTYSIAGTIGVVWVNATFTKSGNGVWSFIATALTNTDIALFTRSTNTANFSNISVRELPGNHATQSTLTSRPILRARYNLLLATETLATQSVTTAATSQRLRFTGAGSITLSGTATGTYTAGTHTVTTTAGTLTLTVSGVVTQADLRAANDALGMPDYQRVNTATDYDTVGFLPYLACDGIDDSMATANIDFTGTDAVTFCAGLRKLSDAESSLLEFSTGSAFSTDGSFAVYPRAPSGGAGVLTFRSRGTQTSDSNTSPLTTPSSTIASGQARISTDLNRFRINASGDVVSTGDQGTGNYGNYPLFLFRRGGTSFPFNGRFKGLVIIGTLLPEGQLQQLERWMNRKTGAF
jgi:hypothetical protein